MRFPVFPIVVVAVLALIAYFGIQESISAELASNHKAKMQSAAEIACKTGTFPRDLNFYDKRTIENSAAIVNATADVFQIIDDGNSKRVKNLRLAAEEITKTHRRIENYYYLAHEWNLYQMSACSASKYPNDDNVKTFSEKSVSLPIKFVARTTPIYPYYEDRSDKIVLELLSATSKEHLPEVEEFLQKYTYHGHLVSQFEQQLKLADQLAKENDFWYNFGKELGIFSD